NTPTGTSTTSPTATPTTTATRTNTPILTPTTTPTHTPTQTPTSTSTNAPTGTPTASPTGTSTTTPTLTSTSTMIPTATATPTETPDPNSCAGKADGTTCDAGMDSAQTLICVSGVCGTCTAFAGSPRFVDNGNGTITDRQSCLVWEKKDDAAGLHDKDRAFQWTSTGTAPDGGAFTLFLAGINSAAFAGHRDWRLPSEAGRNSPFTGPKELESILAAAFPCTGMSSPCVPVAFNTNCAAGCTIDGAGGTQVCSCTRSSSYWSATGSATDLGATWDVSFTNGFVNADDKTLFFFVRAVRGGL